MGQHEESRRETERAGSVPSDGPLDLFLTGEELYRRGDWVGARRAFHRVLAAQPGHFWGQFFLAICQLKCHEWEAARADLNACLSQHPNFIWAYLFRSFANEKLFEADAAHADLDNAMELDSNDCARHALFLTRGVFHFEEGDLDLASADFRSAMRLKPDQHHAYFNLAHVYLAQGKYQAAAEQVDIALRFHPPARAVFGYHAELGRRLLRDARYEDAVRECETALKLTPGLALPLAVRGRALLALGRHEQAERSFDEYLANGGQPLPDVFRARGQARMGLAKYPDAAEDYTRALESFPDGELYQHRAWAHFFSDALKLALRDFTKAIDLKPEAGDAYTGRGLTRVMLGDVPGAVADAEAALSRHPTTPEMMHNVACIFAQAAGRADAGPGSNHSELAEGYLRRAVELVRRTLEMLRAEDRPSFWRDKILTDPALTPIRDDLEFKRLQPVAGGILSLAGDQLPPRIRP
ncbi:MAG TPA: tetratricopeptide repeat protein [Gemmataceae bacterium]|nr:tetratricopeptide repeat protein [Gemmataceae bacterium]